MIVSELQELLSKIEDPTLKIVFKMTTKDGYTFISPVDDGGLNIMKDHLILEGKSPFTCKHNIIVE